MSLLQSLFKARTQEQQGVQGKQGKPTEPPPSHEQLQRRRPAQAIDLDVSTQERCASSLSSKSSDNKADCLPGKSPDGNCLKASPLGATQAHGMTDVLSRFDHSYDRFDRFAR
eukprot:gb/GFBE01014268.1/.p1 GENE.gb/GFBE01014268.1/~~gb/GFBE01014268.1/.p1  ORF type:complete len:113 (+),score=23.19 gb/GFBE01014268.1/:3-341(+)